MYHMKTQPESGNLQLFVPFCLSWLVDQRWFIFYVLKICSFNKTSYWNPTDCKLGYFWFNKRYKHFWNAAQIISESKEYSREIKTNCFCEMYENWKVLGWCRVGIESDVDLREDIYSVICWGNLTVNNVQCKGRCWVQIVLAAAEKAVTGNTGNEQDGKL